MKRILTFLAFLPVLLFGAANDLRVQQMNTGGTAFVDRIFAPVSGTSFTTNAGFKTALGLGLLDSPIFTRVYAGAGTAALPSWAFSGDTDTGFWNKAANNIGIAMNGVDSGYFSNVSSGIALSATSNGAYMALKGAGGIDILAAGTNQPVTIAPSGTASTVLPGMTFSAVSGSNASITATTGNSLTLATLDGNKNVIIAPNGTGITSFGGKGQIKFGTDGGATFPNIASSDGTAGLAFSGNRMLLMANSFSTGLTFETNGDIIWYGSSGDSFYPAGAGQNLGTTAGRFASSYFSGPLYIGAASGTSPTIGYTGASPNEKIIITDGGGDGSSITIQNTNSGEFVFHGAAANSQEVTLSPRIGTTIVPNVNGVVSRWTGGGITDGMVFNGTGPVGFAVATYFGATAQLNSTNTLKFGATAAATIGVSADTTAGNLVLTPPSTGGVAIGATSPVKGIRTNTATLNFASILAAGSEDLTITVTGAAVGDTVAIGLPATVLAGAIFNGWVSAADTVTIRCNNAGSIAIDPASATYRATAIGF